MEPHVRELEFCTYCPKMCRHSCPVSNALGHETLDRVAAKLADQTEETYFRTIDEAGIKHYRRECLGR